MRSEGARQSARRYWASGHQRHARGGAGKRHLRSLGRPTKRRTAASRDTCRDSSRSQASRPLAFAWRCSRLTPPVTRPRWTQRPAPASCLSTLAALQASAPGGGGGTGQLQQAHSAVQRGQRGRKHHLDDKHSSVFCAELLKKARKGKAAQSFARDDGHWPVDWHVPKSIPFVNLVHTRGEVVCGDASEPVNSIDVLSDALAANAGENVPRELDFAAPSPSAQLQAVASNCTNRVSRIPPLILAAVVHQVTEGDVYGHVPVPASDPQRG